MIDSFKYENEYIKVLRIDSSNKWQGVPHQSDMDKQWGIILNVKKNFYHLQNFQKATCLSDLFYKHQVVPKHRFPPR